MKTGIDSAKTKLSDFVANFLVGQGIKTVFAVSGGASLHLIHSVADNENIEFVCTHNEQAAALAADGYSRTSGGIGVAIATSGPGATNLLTGICCSFYDSVPTLFITGQVSTFRMVGKTGVRQIGFQETPIVDVVESVTKYAVTIDDPKKIRYELEKAIAIARSGRSGPVLVDIPDNFQRELIDVGILKGYEKPARKNTASSRFSDIKTSTIESILRCVEKSNRPVIIAGWGVRLSDTVENTIRFAEELSIPVVCTWSVMDIFPRDHPLSIGTFGTHGTRLANFVVQNSDLVISLGSRLDTKATGSPVNTFARSATKVMVDVDIHEIEKFRAFDLHIDYPINTDLRRFFSAMSEFDVRSRSKDYAEWKDTIAVWREILLEYDVRNGKDDGRVDPYDFIDYISSVLPEKCNIYLDTRCFLSLIRPYFQERPPLYRRS